MTLFRAATRLAAIDVSSRRECQDDNLTSRCIELKDDTPFADAQPHSGLPVQRTYIATARQRVAAKSGMQALGETWVALRQRV